jgi:hypothetical protein
VAVFFPSSPRDWQWVCHTVLPRIGMYTGRISFDRTVAFLEGFDAAQDVSIRAMMNNRCEERLGHQTPLGSSVNNGWEKYVKAEALGVDVSDLPRDEEMSDDEHQRAISALRTELMTAMGIEENADPCRSIGGGAFVYRRTHPPA